MREMHDIYVVATRLDSRTQPKAARIPKGILGTFSVRRLSIGSYAYTIVTVATPQHLHSVDAYPKLRHQHHLKATVTSSPGTNKSHTDDSSLQSYL
jgi:hypothetical protein